MGIASLVLGLVSALLGLLPLLPLGGFSVVALLLVALGLPAGLLGLVLGLLSRQSAIRHQRDLGVHTAGLSASVVGALLCLTWVGAVAYAGRRVHQMAEQCRRDPARCASSSQEGQDGQDGRGEAVGKETRRP